MLPDIVEGEFKPAKTPLLWSMEIMKKWLANAKGEDFQSPPDPEKIAGRIDFLNLPKKEARTHVKIDPKVGTSEETQDTRLKRAVLYQLSYRPALHATKTRIISELPTFCK